MPEKLDTVIIGGGQAGLAMSYLLQQRAREHIVLERHRIAERWRTERWDTLRFQLPNAWLTLPGKSYAGHDPGGFSHHPDVLRFILDYATEIAAPVRTGVEVIRLGASERLGEYVVETSGGQYLARHVVIATGPFQRPLVPGFSAAMPGAVQQIDAIHYSNADALPPGAVLVVGSGNSGSQIADELMRSGRRVFLAISRHTRVPRRYRGKDVIWWYDKLGYFDIDIDTFPGRRFPSTTIMTGIDGGYDLAPRHLADQGVTLIGRVLAVSDGVLAIARDAAELLATADKNHDRFIAAADAYSADPSRGTAFMDEEVSARLPPAKVSGIEALDLGAENIGTIIWANGYGYSYEWVQLPILDGNGVPVQTRGVTDSRGVYFLGLHWMHTFRSAILAFMGRDAAHIADHMDRLPPL